MSTWRRKALELFPDLRNEIQQRNFTIYTMFFELLFRCFQAHQDGNIKELEKIYGYAEWCYRQNAKDLCNAAAVAFYEHLGDHRAAREEIHKWVMRDIFKDIAGLLKVRMDEKEFVRLNKQYESHYS